MRKLRAVTFICAPPTPPCRARRLENVLASSSLTTNSSSESSEPTSESESPSSSSLCLSVSLVVALDAARISLRMSSLVAYFLSMACRCEARSNPWYASRLLSYVSFPKTLASTTCARLPTLVRRILGFDECLDNLTFVSVEPSSYFKSNSVPLLEILMSWAILYGILLFFNASTHMPTWYSFPTTFACSKSSSATLSVSSNLFSGSLWSPWCSKDGPSSPPPRYHGLLVMNSGLWGLMMAFVLLSTAGGAWPDWRACCSFNSCWRSEMDDMMVVFSKSVVVDDKNWEHAVVQLSWRSLLFGGRWVQVHTELSSNSLDIHTYIYMCIYIDLHNLYYIYLFIHVDYIHFHDRDMSFMKRELWICSPPIFDKY